MAVVWPLQSSHACGLSTLVVAVPVGNAVVASVSLYIMLEVRGIML